MINAESIVSLLKTGAFRMCILPEDGFESVWLCGNTEPSSGGVKVDEDIIDQMIDDNIIYFDGMDYKLREERTSS
jgi:hypothetical protein